MCTRCAFVGGLAALLATPAVASAAPGNPQALEVAMSGMRRIAGIGALTARGIPAFGNPLTIGLALDNGLPVPRPLHGVQKQRVRFGPVEVFYPGAGHTLDNVVAWIPRDRVLFGGCLVKSVTELGNVADGYAAPRHVIPGHGTIAGEPVAHTVQLAAMSSAA